MKSNQSFTDHFLIAMPGMRDPRFAKSVVYLCEHNEDGAIGLVINKPITVTLREVFEQMSIPSVSSHINQREVFFGGPVQPEMGFVMFLDESESVETELQVSTSKEILEDIAAGHGPNDFMVMLGYAAWEAGQLESEMLENAWLSVPKENSVIFNCSPKGQWEAAAKLIGIDIHLISDDVGHA